MPPKGGKRHEVPVHHTLEQYLDAYVDTAGIREATKGPLFRTLATAPGRPLSLTPLAQAEAVAISREGDCETRNAERRHYQKREKVE